MRLPRRVEQPPASVKIGFEDRVEIGWYEAIGVAADEARGNLKTAAERDPEMRKVAADSGPLEQGLIGGGFFVTAPALIFEMLVNPAANRVHPFMAGSP